jgi:uncharacterized protein (TIRG00374 family)
MSHLRWVVGIVISGIALYVAFVGVDWRGVGHALRDANYWLLLAALPIWFIFTMTRAERWRVLFQPDIRLGFWSVFGALQVGYLAGTVLPLQLGEIARVYALTDREKLRSGRVLSTVAIERLLDVFALLAILAILIPFINLPRAAAISAAVIFAGFIVFTGFAAIAAVDRPRVERWFAWLLRLVPARLRHRVEQIGHSVLDGLVVLRHPRILFSALFWTFTSWMISAVVFYLGIRAFSLDVSFAAAPFLLVATTFGFFVPSSPGAIGVYHAIVIRSLTSVFSVPHDAATSFALVIHALYVIPPTIIGALFFWWYHLSLRRIESLSLDEELAANAPGELSVAADPPRTS